MSDRAVLTIGRSDEGWAQGNKEIRLGGVAGDYRAPLIEMSNDIIAVLFIRHCFYSYMVSGSRSCLQRQCMLGKQRH